MRDVVQHSVGGVAVGQRVSMPEGIVTTTRPLKMPLIQTDVDPTNSYYIGTTRVLDFFGLRIAPNFASGDVLEFLIPQTLVAATCNPGDATLTVFTTADFPAYPFNILVDAEAMRVTGLASPGVWNVTRAQLGTSAATHNKYVAVSQKCSTGFLDVVGLGIDGTNAPATTATAQLNGAVNSSQTTITVKNVVGTFPIDRRFTVTIGSGANVEKMLVTGGMDGLTWNVTRNYGGSGATPTHSDGDAVQRVASLVKFNGGTVVGSYISKLTLKSYRLEHFPGNAVVMEGSCFENVIQTPHVFANLANVIGNCLTLQSLGNSATNVGVSSVDVYGGTMSRGSRGIHAIETDVKVFGGTYLQADQEAIRIASSRESAIYGAHFEDNCLGGIASTGSDWSATGVNQAAIYVAGGVTVNGCAAHAGAFHKQRYLLRVFAPSTDSGRPVTVSGGSTFAGQSDYYVRVEGTGPGSVTLIGIPAGDNGTWVDGSSGNVKVTEINSAGLGNILINGSAPVTTATPLSSFAVPTADLNFNTHRGVNVLDPASAQDIATKHYVDVNTGVDPLAQAAGLVNWNGNPASIVNASSLTSQTVYLMALYLPPGKLITNIVLIGTLQSSGSIPTGYFLGLASDSGVMLRQTPNLTAAGAVVLGPIAYGLTATYTTSPSDSPSGLYFVVALINGTWGTQVPTFLRGSAQGGAAFPFNTGLRMFATGVTARTVLPANGSNIGALTNANVLGLWAGVS
jgi:hypothetical protein